MADYYLTRRAASDLREIYQYSVDTWEEVVADTYMDTLFFSLQRIASNPDIGKKRQKRAAPYLMAPVAKHFAVYESIENGIIVVTILHGRRDIEGILNKISRELAKEVEQIKQKLID